MIKQRRDNNHLHFINSFAIKAYKDKIYDCMVESKYLKSRSMPSRQKKGRIFEIDFLRGFDIILMVAVHFCYAASSYGVMGMLFNERSMHYGSIVSMNEFCGNVFGAIVYTTRQPNPFGEGVFTLLFLEIFFSGLFVFLSGISCSFTRNNAKRSFQLAYVAELLTVGTIFLSAIANNVLGIGNDHNPAVIIICGILQTMAIALLLYSLYDHFFPKFYQTFIAAIVFSIIAIITSYFYADSDTGYIHNANLPEEWWQLLVGIARYGDDSFSPPQIIATLFLGASFGKLFYRERKSLLPKFNTKWATPILFLGRHSLAVYILHVPLIYGFLILLYLLLGYTIK